MSGVGFTAAWLYAKSGSYQTIAVGPYDESITKTWPGIIKQLKDLPVVITQGNAGPLDMLNRGEIDIGPVWVDMLLLWKSDGRMNPNIRMSLPEPGMPGQPMYLVVGSKGKNAEAARLFCDFIADPAIQAEYVVGKYTWYPGVDSVAVFEKCSEESKKLLFSEVTADEISKKGLALPLSAYMKEMQKLYAEVR
jgi:ABC-type Fe3+ transport system substrate-binding protein